MHSWTLSILLVFINLKYASVSPVNQTLDVTKEPVSQGSDIVYPITDIFSMFINKGREQSQVADRASSDPTILQVHRRNSLTTFGLNRLLKMPKEQILLLNHGRT